jgi:hypothetical protein
MPLLQLGQRLTGIILFPELLDCRPLILCSDLLSWRFPILEQLGVKVLLGFLVYGQNGRFILNFVIYPLSLDLREARITGSMSRMSLGQHVLAFAQFGCARVMISALRFSCLQCISGNGIGRLKVSRASQSQKRRERPRGHLVGGSLGLWQVHFNMNVPRWQSSLEMSSFQGYHLQSFHGGTGEAQVATGVAP